MIINDKKYTPFPNQKRGNKYLNTVRERMIKIGLNEKDLLDLIHLEKNSFLDQFKKKSNPQPPFTRRLVMKLYTVCHIDPRDFLIGNEEEEQYMLSVMYREYCINKKKVKSEEEYKKNYFTHKYWEKLKKLMPTRNSNIDIRPIKLTSHESTKSELTDFYEKIAVYYDNACESIIAHEVLFKGNNNNPNKYGTYREAQDKIFTAIDRALKENRITYKRVFYLSPSEWIHPKNIRDPHEMFKIMMIEASFETLRHIRKCLNEYPDLCEFFVAPFSGFRAHTLIDEKLLITEDYKNHADYIKPYLLFIDNVEAGSDVGKIKELFTLELKERNEKHIYRLNKESFPTFIEEAADYLNNRVEEQDNVLDFLKDIKRAEIRRNSDDQIIKYTTSGVATHIRTKTESMKNILGRQHLDVMGKLNNMQFNNFKGHN